MIGPLLDWLDTGNALSVTEARMMLGDAFEWVLASNIAEPAGTATTVVCPKCLHGETLKLRRYGAGWRAVCGNGGGSHIPQSDEIALLAPVRQAMARELAAVVSEGVPKMLSNQSVWELGHLEVNGIPRAVFLAFSSERPDRVSTTMDAVDSRGSQWTGAILTAGTYPSSIRTRSGHRFVPAEEAITVSNRGLDLDVGRLAQLLRGEPRKRHQPSPRASRRQKWVLPALQTWEELDARRLLTSNVSEGMRLVRAALLKLDPPLEFVPEIKALTAELGPRHRKAHPRRKPP